MPLSTVDQQLIDTMKEREFNLKKRQRAANAIYNEGRRYRRMLMWLAAAAFGLVLLAVFIAVQAAQGASVSLWPQAVEVFIVGTLIGLLVSAGWLRTPMGRNLLTHNEVRLDHKHSGDLYAGRRWQQFYYRGEDISAYVPQILYMIESEHRFGSVDEALAFAKEHSHQNSRFSQHGLELFTAVAAETNLIVIASADEDGRTSSRFMRFVKTDRPGVWYVTTAPDAPKVHEFDRGVVSIITAPTERGGAISSNRVRIRRAGKSLAEIADLFREQAPRYLDGMTAEDLELELVYELTLESAKVSNWVEQTLVVFDHG